MYVRIHLDQQQQQMRRALHPLVSCFTLLHFNIFWKLLGITTTSAECKGDVCSTVSLLMLVIQVIHVIRC